MTLRHMRIFAEVYRTRNVTHAARNLHMTQPAVTRAIQELEQHYGVRLFERLYRHLSPHPRLPSACMPRPFTCWIPLTIWKPPCGIGIPSAWCGWGQRSRWAAPSFRCWPPLCSALPRH